MILVVAVMIHFRIKVTRSEIVQQTRREASPRGDCLSRDEQSGDELEQRTDRGRLPAPAR
jgi:hypothetical protein